MLTLTVTLTARTASSRCCGKNEGLDRDNPGREMNVAVDQKCVSDLDRGCTVGRATYSGAA